MAGPADPARRPPATAAAEVLARYAREVLPVPVPAARDSAMVRRVREEMWKDVQEMLLDEPVLSGVWAAGTRVQVAGDRNMRRAAAAVLCVSNAFPYEPIEARCVGISAMSRECACRRKIAPALRFLGVVEWVNHASLTNLTGLLHPHAVTAVLPAEAYFRSTQK